MSDITKRIIYTTSEGLSIIWPMADCSLTVEEIQAKDVPDGETSYIIDETDLPTDLDFRDAWTYTP